MRAKDKLTADTIPVGQHLILNDSRLSAQLYIEVMPGGKLTYKVVTDAGVYHTEDPDQAALFFNGEWEADD